MSLTDYNARITAITDDSMSCIKLPFYVLAPKDTLDTAYYNLVFQTKTRSGEGLLLQNKIKTKKPR